ncbi:transcription factor E2F5-like [Ambystoma mexicanum]|uniref:transcription factor E2F5-like n=1 Tax=Ambystoma mexicanum TaxID=8296 RepID=UPI0037E7F46C
MLTCSYVTPEDIYNCFDAEDALLIVHAPAGSQVMIPVPEMGQNEQLKYQMILKSRPGPVRVLLVNQEYSSSEPVLYPVPAPEDPTQPATQVTPQCQAISMPAPALAEGQDQGTPSAAAPSDCSVAPNSTATTSSDPEPSPSLAADNAHTTARLNNYLPSVPLEVRTSLKTSPLEVGEFDECGDTLISDIIELMSSDGILITEIIDELMSSQVFPHLPHSPTTGDGAKFNVDDYDGVCNLLNV